MPKIVHLTSAHQPFDTRIFRKQCRSLAKHGFEVVLIAPHSQDEVVDQVQLRAFPRPSSRLGRMTSGLLHVLRRALNEQADLFHIHDPELLPIGLCLKLFGYRVVFDMHENLPASILNKGWIPRGCRWGLSKAISLMERVLLYKTPVVFAELSYKKHYEWVRSYCFALNAPLLESTPVANSYYPRASVGYIGGISAARGSMNVLKSLALLNNQFPPVDCYYVGPVEQFHKAELEQYAAKNLPGKLHVPGYLEAPEGWAVVSRCHVGVAILQPHANYYESFPTKVAEYMTMGIPVVVSDFPLYREMVDSSGAGICVNPDSPREIADAIQWLLSHPEEAAEMGRNGQAFVRESYNWSTQFQSLLTLYAEVLNENVDRGRCTSAVCEGGDCQSNDREAA